MRKKYLSALLFGALLFASAGTFTSCKDYDDDINNLQEQIDQVAKDLNDLKTKVDALGGYVENVSFADGVLSVTTGGNTVTYNIPDKTGVNNVTLALDGNNLVLDVDGEKQTVALPANESGDVEIPQIEVKDGVLYINGEPQTLKVDVESNVTVIESTIPGNETYTVMVNGEEVTFAKAFADVRIDLVAGNTTDGFYFTEYGITNPASESKYGIHWARSSKDVTWDGPKGNITNGMLVVGQITAAQISVRPVNYELENQELTLVSSTGDVAPVKVIAYKGQDNGPLHGVTRAANVNYETLKQGEYALAIQLNSDLTDRQVIESFATTDGNYNVKYALAVNGVVATDYDFVIDTQLKADTQTKCEDPDATKFLVGGMDYNDAPLGTHQMSYESGRVYDMKVEIDPSSQSDAAVYGVSVDTKTGTITAGANAANRTFKLKVTLIDVNGNVSATKVISVTFKKQDVIQNTELSPIAYTVTPLADKSVVINLGDVFTSLSDEDAIALLTRDNIEWDIEDTDDTFIIAKTTLDVLNGNISGGITYYEDAACTKEIQANDFRNGDKVKSIKYAKIPVTAYNNAATLGEHLLSITLEREVGVPGSTVDKTIKKVNVPVDVQLPAWEDLFSQPTQTWDSDTYVTRIIDVQGSGASRQAVVSMDAYAAVAGKGANADDIVVTRIAANIGGNVIDVKDNQKKVSNNFKLASSASIADSNGNLPAADMTVDFQYTIGGVSEFTMKETGVKVHIKSIFEDATYVWYDKDGKETAGPAEMNGVDNTIKGTGSEDSDKKSGLALRFSSQNIEIGDLGTANSHFNIVGLMGGIQTIQTGASTQASEIQYSWAATSDGVSNITITGTPRSGSVNTANYVNSYITLTPTSGMISDNGGTITLTFTDYLGVKTQVVIPFVKKNL